MRLGIIAYGRAGCRIAAAFKRREKRSMTHLSEFIMLADTASQQLIDVDVIDDDWKAVYGEPRFAGTGTAGKLGPGVEAAKATTQNIESVLQYSGTNRSNIDAFLVIGSLGGGTGGSGAPVAAKYLTGITGSTPVYGVGVLPAPCEPDIYTVNAARSIQSFAAATDTVLLFDNKTLGVAEPDSHPDVPDDIPASDVFGPVNKTIAELIHTVFAADTRTTGSELPGAVADQDDITSVLGTGGLSTVSFVEKSLPRPARPGVVGRAARFLNTLTSGVRAGSVRDWPHPTDLVEYVASTDASMLPPVTPDDAARTLTLLTGPRDHLHASHVTDTADWAVEAFENELTVVKADPRRRAKAVSLLTVCSGIGIPPRVEDLLSDAEHVAREVQQQQQQQSRERDPKSVNVFDDDSTRIPPAF
ncbi:hypothetical protein [Halorubrum halodurans]|uniref:Uncharacterized protein n=1 Tax=Halorubrum halodurans TaxID=1383851 RepID=A0A256IJK5_9EURY|nr:hypothetical protein [Halorubrum halodurans]OYR56633.1 hypothetical protein DJ70_07915 [Halorubrum halodurans]